MYSRIDVQKLPLKNVQVFVWWPEQIKNINKISYIPTYEDEMMHKAYQTYRYFPLFKHRGVYFPPPAKGWRSTLSLQNGKLAELLPFVKLLHSYGLCPLNHQPYFLPCHCLTKMSSMIFRLGPSINILWQINSPFPHMSPSIHKQIITQSFSNIPLCSNIQQSTFPHQPAKTGLSIVWKSKIS